MNGLDFIFYGHNTFTSDVITQVFKFVGTKSLFADVDLELILQEAGENIFNDRKMFYPREFCDTQKVIEVNTYGVQTNEKVLHLFLEDFWTVAQTHEELLVLVLASLGDYAAQFFRLSTYFNMVGPHIYI